MHKPRVDQGAIAIAQNFNSISAEELMRGLGTLATFPGRASRKTHMQLIEGGRSPRGNFLEGAEEFGPGSSQRDCLNCGDLRFEFQLR